MSKECIEVQRCKCECFKQHEADPRWFSKYYIPIDVKRKPGQPYCVKCGHHIEIDKLPGDWQRSHEDGYGMKLTIGKEEIRASV